MTEMMDISSSSSAKPAAVQASASKSSGWEEELGKIIARIFAKRDSELFRDPVPHEELGLVDYLSVVTTPMDLGTVRSKLDGHQYKSENQCAEDIRLIWYNAMLYNAPGAQVYVKAKILSEYWEAQWASFCNGAADVNKPPASLELQSFAENCYRISPNDLGQVLAMLEKESPACLVKKGGDSKEVEVNVDLINGRVFKAVSEFARALVEAE